MDTLTGISSQWQRTRCSGSWGRSVALTMVDPRAQAVGHGERPWGAGVLQGHSRYRSKVHGCVSVPPASPQHLTSLSGTCAASFTTLTVLVCINGQWVGMPRDNLKILFCPTCRKAGHVVPACSWMDYQERHGCWPRNYTQHH